MTTPSTICPECGEDALIRDEVDIGVGIQYGPAHCEACHYDEASKAMDFWEKTGVPE